MICCVNLLPVVHLVQLGRLMVKTMAAVVGWPLFLTDDSGGVRRNLSPADENGCPLEWHWRRR